MPLHAEHGTQAHQTAETLAHMLVTSPQPSKADTDSDSSSRSLSSVQMSTRRNPTRRIMIRADLKTRVTVSGKLQSVMARMRSQSVMAQPLSQSVVLTCRGKELPREDDSAVKCGAILPSISAGRFAMGRAEASCISTT